MCLTMTRTSALNFQVRDVTWMLFASLELLNLVHGDILRGLVPAQWGESYDVVDLSHNFNEWTIYWDDNGYYKLNVTIYNATSSGWFQEDVMEEAIHGGTHLDSPVHFYKGGWDATQIPLNRLMFLPVAVVDVREQVAQNPEYMLSVGDILLWEERNGQLPSGCLFVAHTGQSKHWPNRTAYMGIDANGDKHFPALQPEAASYLATQRSVYGVGVDTPSVDAAPDDAAHRAVSAANIFILENLVGLEKLPPRGAYAIVLPLKLDGASGSPVRVVALAPP
ncbi:isatin hydrolase-like [Dermacentor albipictus]|uniref:isatin hydrolase-like n=1 Tax=Dermacentor albipictus TaxID=60249 RepID=UPI0031FC6DF5